jgi:hypothetical protein
MDRHGRRLNRSRWNWSHGRSELFSEELPMSLIFAEDRSLQRDVSKEGGRRAADENLHRLIVLGTALTFPRMPPSRQNLLHGGALELDRDEELGRIVEHWIGAHEKP